MWRTHIRTDHSSFFLGKSQKREILGFFWC
uniref:Uncharacterized protein n=1 Tax=Anguilla anguilla TaxID=7936 RepID=A0A0E9W6L9_ANGAN